MHVLNMVMQMLHLGVRIRRVKAVLLLLKQRNSY